MKKFSGCRNSGFSDCSRFLLPFLVLLLLTYRGRKMMIVTEIYATIRSFGVGERLARYICAQAAHETGDFTSELFRGNYNLFGMKQPKIRQTTSLYETGGYATYRNIKEATEDFFLYLKAQGFALEYQSVDSYIAALTQKKYFKAPVSEYLSGVKYFLKKYFNE